MKGVNEKNVIQARLKWARNTLNMYDDDEIRGIIDHLNESSDEFWIYEEAREWLRTLGKSDNEIERLFTALQLLKSQDEMPVAV